MTSNHTSKHKFGARDWRVALILFVFFVIFSAIAIRLSVVQISRGAFFQEVAYEQHTVNASLAPKRGEIFLHNGNESQYPVAVNRAYQTLCVSPKDVENVEETVRWISELLQKDEDSVWTSFRDLDDPFEIVARKVNEDIARVVSEEKRKGIFLIEETARFYPADELASQTIGFVGNSGESVSGRYGIEAAWEATLAGVHGSVRQERDAGGRWISTTDREFLPQRDGSDITLTIDANVQYETERVLRERMETHSADSASAVVLEVGTGRILAMANMPSFDPNRYGEVEDMRVFRNSVVSDNYEAGSVFKPIVMAMGIDAGKIAPSTTFVDTGSVFEAGYTIKNSEEKVYGKQTMTQVLEESINTGMIFVQRQLGNALFRDYVKAFGFGERAGVGLPAEASGNITNLDTLNRTINFYTASFGQGISMTLLQVARAYDVIANGGMLVVPKIVDSVSNKNGTKQTMETEVLRRVIQEDAAQYVREMLFSVVESGHGKRAAVAGYRVGGKTGTAQVAKRDARGYSDDETVGTFVGLAPVDNPRFVVAVKVRNPKDVIWAESSAAPAFGDIMKFLLGYYGVEPTEEIDL
jgi:cell division protein FtsI/penicillin-binding protein 2